MWPLVLLGDKLFFATLKKCYVAVGSFLVAAPTVCYFPSCVQTSSLGRKKVLQVKCYAMSEYFFNMHSHNFNGIQYNLMS